jgi:tRNA(His) guanylyltransferase
MKDKIGTRMKEQYESRFKNYLVRRCPTILRLDGKAFHTYTKGLNKPFDQGLIEDMQSTSIYLCENIQGVKCAYTQSDEISLLLTDYETITTDAWFNYEVSKMCSVAASLATAKFNQLRLARYLSELWDSDNEFILDQFSFKIDTIKLAHFDCRVFQIPDKEEVVNSFIWRQQDAVRNSIQMLAQSLYSQKELHKKNTSELQELCFQKGHNWNNLEFYKKRGSFIIKNTYYNDYLVTGDDSKDGEYIMTSDAVIIRTKWECIETPTFSQNRESIMKFL